MTHRIHYFQHVPFESPAHIAVWAKMKGHQISRSHLFDQERIPSPRHYDWLIIMGGPMSVHDSKIHPWLEHEKEAIHEAIQSGKKVLGICLGAQLIASVLGGTVTQNQHREIGWFPVRLHQEASRSKPFKDWPGSFTAFHWHGETFSLPPQSQWIASSEACAHQAFAFHDLVVGFQFHLESTQASVEALVQQCPGDLTDSGAYVQTQKEIFSKLHHVPTINTQMEAFLNNMASL